MWARVPGAYTPELMVSSLETLKEGYKQVHDNCKPSGDMVLEPKSLDWPFFDLESRAPSVLAGGAPEAA